MDTIVFLVVAAILGIWVVSMSMRDPGGDDDKLWPDEEPHPRRRPSHGPAHGAPGQRPPHR